MCLCFENLDNPLRDIDYDALSTVWWSGKAVGFFLWTRDELERVILVLEITKGTQTAELVSNTFTWSASRICSTVDRFVTAIMRSSSSFDALSVPIVILAPPDIVVLEDM